MHGDEDGTDRSDQRPVEVAPAAGPVKSIDARAAGDVAIDDADPTESDVGDEPAEIRPPTGKVPLRLSLLVLLLFAAFAGTINLISQIRDDRYSPLDENTHVAYAYDAGHLRFPYAGSVYSQAILDDWTCRGQTNLASALPACGAHTPAAEFPLKGLQYNFFHPPLYYLVTGATALVIDRFFPGFHFTFILRLLSAVWLIAAMWWLFHLLVSWGVRRGVAVCAGIGLACVPFIIHAARIGTNDAPAALCGVAAAFVLGRIVLRRNDGWILPAVLTAAASATKTLNGLPLIAVGMVLGVIGIRNYFGGDRRRGLAWLKIGAAIGVAAAAVYVIWLEIQNARGVPGYVSPIRLPDPKSQFAGLPFDEWFRYEFDGFDLAGEYFLHPFFHSLILAGWIVLFATVLSAACFIGVTTFRTMSARWLLSLSLLVGCLVYPLLVQVMRYSSSDGKEYFPTYSNRYGLSLVPVAIIVLVIVVDQRRHLRRAWAVITLGGAVAVLGTAVSLFPQ